MKSVEIKNKVVARDGGTVGTPTAKGASVDLSGYLLKQIWEKVFEFRTTDDGTEYLFAKMNLAVQYGISSFIDGEKINLPGLYDGIPFDNRTIWMNPETGLVEVLVQGGEGGGTADFSNVISSGSGNAFTSFSVSGDGQRLTLVKGETFALQSDLEDIDSRLTAFLEGSDTNTIIDKWRELEDFLSGLRESDNLSEILSDKADKATTLAGYGITNAYTKTQVDDLLSDKADAATTLAGYGIADAYTKKQVDDLLSESVVPEELPNPFSLSWSGYSSGSYDGSSAKSIVIPNNTNQLTNGAGFITSITKTMVTDALGFTPYSSSNPSGFITSSGSISGNAATATKLKTSRTIWGQNFDGSGNVSGNLSLGSSNLLMESDNSYGDSSWAIFAYGPTLQFKYGSSGGSASTMALQISSADGQIKAYGDIIPSSNQLYDLGSSSYQWANVYTDCVNIKTGENAYTDADIYFKSGSTTYARIGSNTSGNLALYARTSIVLRGGATSSSAPTNGVTIDASGNVLVTGGITSLSDARKKTILNHVELSLKQVADAPIIEFYYNSDEKKTTHVGSIAQYWAKLNDWFCKEDEEGFLTIEIQNAALASAISVARELSRYESKTDKRIRELEIEVEDLKRKLYGNI